MVFVSGCTTYSTIETSSYKYLYDYESSYLHPDYLIYHSAEDSSTLYFKLNTKELLYTRKDPASPFVARVNIHWELQQNTGNSYQAIDSSSFVVTDLADAPVEKWLGGTKVIPLPAVDNQFLLITMTDINKQVTSTTRINISKTDKTSRQNFLLMNTTGNEPVFGNSIPPETYVNIYSARNSTNDIYIFQNDEETRLPPPPFSNNEPEFPDLNYASAVSPEFKSESVLTFETKEGMYFITTDVSRSKGVALIVCDPHYPEIKDVAQLTWPLRYISSKSEFEEIQKNNYPKLLVDNFWMDCGGSKDRARDLIRIYYNRVREANYYFTSYTEGWRTDRGMIHLVFGNPTKINKSGDGETWIYGEEGNVSSLQFYFRKVDSPVSGNVYVLLRDPLFKSHWERAVTAWRNGKVYNE